MPPAATTLGTYLRACRARVRPGDVGLPGGPGRRVPGLRREEVALLAGISVEYYLRLEQGRDTHPSEQVLVSLARAPLLEPDAATYLRELASPPRPTRRARPHPDRVGQGVRELLDQWAGTPALVQGPHMTILAANLPARALCPHFAPGRNALRALFLEPGMREFYRDWEATTAKAVAWLRSVAGGTDDPGLVALVGELSLRSERFRGLWARQDVRRTSSGVTRLRHPQVGDLDLRYEKLAFPQAPGQTLIVYHAEVGTPSHDGLQLLAHLTPPTGPGGLAPRAAPSGRSAQE